MRAIEIMVEEHKAIKRMLAVMRKACYAVMKGSEIDYEDFKTMIAFVRGYADAHHHGKEEKMLFNQMVASLGPAAQKLVTHGMLVEHDLGRLYMADLERALEAVKEGNLEAKLDVVAHAVGYTHLLHRHIDKEDGVVYPFAKRSFSETALIEIDKACAVFESEQHENGVQDKYLRDLERLEAKYL
ncbi:hemerythrin domain-containing protein [Fusibacter tunisiensis]|jgi:hemerythrin-like domain-containing protein|uniref:Hemerythrin-like domain-containing protein n=1 Tax=Fusibacter tunisiensis TaxID=1008308 RepID=A0ABS2MN46_9FIRM|nr:hemerythrin domain-containing protein [Fusibacter tunisiensis]MBM7560816.1 hemerythrin-like domain-containing protein [Fusibacter tunisiensis]